MTNKINNFSFIQNREAAASFHDAGVVILHTGKGCLFSSNLTGAQIWRGIEQQLSMDVIAREISGEYQIPLTTAREHTVHFLTELQRHELVLQEVRS
jgi:Coenzyme PQQ synthesis protein D (PqqD)